MRVSRAAPEIILDRVQREQLEALTRASSASQAEVLRARIILLAALNRTNEEIADELRTRTNRVQVAASLRPAWLGGLAGRSSFRTARARVCQHSEHCVDESDSTAPRPSALELPKHGQAGRPFQELGSTVVVPQRSEASPNPRV